MGNKNKEGIQMKLKWFKAQHSRTIF